MRTIHIANILDSGQRTFDAICQQTAGNTEAEAIEAARIAWAEYFCGDAEDGEDEAAAWQDILDGDGDWVLVLTTVDVPDVA